MPSTYTEIHAETRHTDDVQDIITSVPSWILRWGITLFFCILMLLVALSAFIRYPDIIKTQLKITSPNVAKPVVPKITGKLVKLLVKNDQEVVADQPLAYIESTADHSKVLALLTNLKKVQKQLSLNQPVNSNLFNNTANTQLGELQAAYQSFAQAYISYKSTVEDGFLLKKRAYLQKDITSLNEQAGQLKAEKSLQQQDLKLAEDEYAMHQKLAKAKVETPAELRQQESKYLSKKSPLIQTDASLISANANLLAKQKEILELDNQILEEKAGFAQALNSLISQMEDWENKYILSASQAGKVSFAGIVQQNQVVSPGQEVFYINSGNDKFFGEMTIPQDNLGKVKKGQEVLIKLKSYPFEEYGMLRGRISYIADVPYRDSIFISRVDFRSNSLSDLKKPVHLKQGMVANAEIVTEDATILQRLTRNVTKAISSN
ncbi:HlyD family secretion protein [Mucilaginibacter segetis]|uniref:HlyD family efflux transporter periplasmic adaptor subunit n=1 Tax=Mucilaginibacter segetis TaxID=2793071 RepID=A0A934PQI6_9SPHI|nr:HlyD family efflux transporter periplasmic adaptor subunit [Mucilaginibacter segetis]MBK0378903.1 HlyD family efflux transporter periplasmic adaptor subunit [Mucilaginibacter segetis]